MTSGGDQLRPVSPTRGWGRRQGAINYQPHPVSPTREGVGRREVAINSVRSVLPEGGGDVRG